MTIWLPQLGTRTGPRYLALADAIEQDVVDGTLPVGARLPPHRDLAYRLGVTVGTVSRAYALAATRGLVTGEVGRGTFVRLSDENPRVNPVDDGTDELIRLTVNAPPDPAYRSLLRDGLAELSANPASLQDLLSYTPKRGLADHRATVASWIGRLGIDARADDVIITAGAHQAVLAALAGLARRGDTVLVESLTYAGICHVAERLGLRPHGLALDDEGLVPEALDVACRAGAARLLVTNPVAHNPTTATMSLERRQAIAVLARKHDLIVLEDDVYGRLPEERPPPIAALAPERTIYITSASKSIAPGLRLGMLLSPSAYLQPIADVQHDLFLTCPPLMPELFKLWLRNGTAERLAQRQCVEARARQDLARQILAGHSYDAQPTTYHIWLPLPAPWRTSQFVAAARERGVMVDPSSAFAVDQAQAPHAVRVSLSAAASRARLSSGLRVLAELLAEPPARRREVI
jgi:DNA-binding transcriptional MocR family regulator